MEPNEIVKGKYRIDKTIPSGPSNYLYQAYDIQNKRQILLKTFSSPDVCTLISSQKENLFALPSGHIPKVYDVDSLDEGKLVYIAEEFVDGESLAKFLKNRGITYRQFFEIFDNLLDAVDSIHRSQMVHGDIKPQNILIRHDQDRTVGVLIDIDSAFMHEKGTAYGSLYYAAPEQIIDGDFFPKSDIYALGWVAYYLIEQKHPFAPSRKALQERLAGTRKVRLPHIQDADIRVDLEILFNEMADVDASNRPRIENIKKRMDQIRRRAGLMNLLDRKIEVESSSGTGGEKPDHMDSKFSQTTIASSAAQGSTKRSGIPDCDEEFRTQLMNEYKQLTTQAAVTFRLWKVTFGMGLILIVLAVIMIFQGKYNEALLSIALESLVYFAQRLFSMREEYYQKQNDEKLKHLRALNYYNYAENILDKTDPEYRNEKIDRMLNSIFSRIE